MIGPLRIATATFFVTTSEFYRAQHPAADPGFPRGVPTRRAGGGER